MKFKASTYSVSTAADVFDSMLGIFYLILVVVGPLFYLVFFAVNGNKLRKNEGEGFVEKFETLFESIKVDQQCNINYNAIFMLRRFIFVMTCIYLNGKYSSFQILYAIVSAMLYICYLINYRPLKCKEEGHLELFTEMCMLLFIYTMLTFTDFTEDIDTKYQMGWVAIAIFFFNLLINLWAVFRGLFVTTKQNYR